jgi:hypothetical protein
MKPRAPRKQDRPKPNPRLTPEEVAAAIEHARRNPQPRPSPIDWDFIRGGPAN